MTNIKKQNNQLIKKINGTTDYQYYEKRARTLRSDTIRGLLSVIFIRKRTVNETKLK
jgi:hypothetical protein